MKNLRNANENLRNALVQGFSAPDIIITKATIITKRSIKPIDVMMENEKKIKREKNTKKNNGKKICAKQCVYLNRPELIKYKK